MTATTLPLSEAVPRLRRCREEGWRERGTKRARLWMAGLCAAVVLSGCQAGTDVDAPDPSLSATASAAPVATNELDRLGRQDLDLENSGLAEEHFRQAVEKNAADGYAWVGLAVAYDNLRRFELADRAYAQAIKLQGETLPILNDIGYSYYLRGDRVHALEKLRHAAALYPDSVVLSNNMRLVQSGEQPNRHVAP